MTTTSEALIERFDHLRNSGVCSPTTRALLDDAQSLITALSTPPAAPEGNFDVREAVRFLLHTGGVGEDGRQDADLLAGELHAQFEVRPHGTVPAEQISDAKVHAAYEAFVAGPVDAHASMRAALKAAQEVRNAAH